MKRARFSQIKNGGEKDPEMDISSLVDVAFLLLIFFLVTSTLLPREGDLEIALLGEESTRTEPMQLPPLGVQITEAGSVLIDGDLVEDAGGGSAMSNLTSQLERHMRIAKAADCEPIVIFMAADKARHQRLVDALNAITGVGISRVSFDSGWKAES